MTCFHPIIMYKPRYAQLDIPPRDYYALKKLSKHPSDFRTEVQVACGHCLGCRLDHASMWQTRIMMEAKTWQSCYHITITYNDKHLHTKYNLTQLNKDDLQKFLKRLRYYFQGYEEWTNPKTGKIEKPLRYYACGEYGQTGTRAKIGGNPHYHIAMFNLKLNDLKLYKLNEQGDPIFKSKTLQKIWGKGFVTIEELNFESAGYVARYVQKKAGIKAKKRFYTGKIRKEMRIDERNGKLFEHLVREQKYIKGLQVEEFQTMSRAVGIGRLYWEQNKDKIKRNSGIMFKTKKGITTKPIPRYFKKIWEDENYEEFYRWRYERTKEGIKKKIEIINKIKLKDCEDDEIKFEFYLKTQEHILISKALKLKRKGIE